MNNKIYKLNSLKSVYELNSLMNNYYKQLENAEKKNKLTAAVSLGFPIDILLAYDILPFFPQNHSAMFASLKKSRDEIEFAESKGIPVEICSEIKIFLSSMLYNHNLSFKVPAPDMVICSNNVCKAVIKLFEIMSEYYNVPFFMLDIPFVPEEEISEDSIKYIEDQLDQIIEFIKYNFKLKLDEDKLLDIAKLSRETGILWHEIVNFGANIPSPYDALDIFAHMFPYMNMARTPEVIYYYKLLRGEIIARLEDDVSAIEDEEIRLLWDYMPIFSKNNFFRRLFGRHNAVAVTNTFFLPGTSMECRKGTCGFNDSINTYKDLFNYWARSYSFLYAGVNINTKLEIIDELVKKFSIDGVVIHKDNSCKPQSLPQQELHNLIRDRLKVPCLTINADSADMRHFSEAQVTTRVEAFLENIKFKGV